MKGEHSYCSTKTNTNMSKSTSKKHTNCTCSVPRCHHRRDKTQNLSLHLVPRNPEIRRQWQKVLGIQLSKWSYVCSDHFHERDFANPQSALTRRLLRGKLPSRNLPYETKENVSNRVLRRKLPSRNIPYDSKENVGIDSTDIYPKPTFSFTVAEISDSYVTANRPLFRIEDIQIEDISPALLESSLKATNSNNPSFTKEEKIINPTEDEKIPSSTKKHKVIIPAVDEKNPSPTEKQKITNTTEDEIIQVSLLPVNLCETVLIEESSILPDAKNHKSNDVPTSTKTVTLIEKRTPLKTSNLLISRKSSDDTSDVHICSTANYTVQSTFSVSSFQLLDMEESASDGKQRTCATQLLRNAKLNNFLDLIVNEVHLSTWMGLTSFKLFDRLCQTVKRLSLQIPNPGDTTLDMTSRVALTLIKIKTDLPFLAISTFFKTSAPVCLEAFNSTVPLLEKILLRFLPWPAREKNKKDIPRSFTRFPDTRVILDTIEVPVQAPTCSDCRFQTYSTSKKQYALKFMIGISTKNLITFVSKIHGWNASNKFMVLSSGILETLEPGDAILMDKDYFISEECREAGVKLIQPVVMSNQQLISSKDAQYNRSVAGARVHLQRVIDKMKKFNMLNKELRWNLLPSFPSVARVVCCLVNLSQPTIMTDMTDFVN